MAFLLSACQGVPERNEGSPYFELPVGSRLIVQRDLALPAGGGLYLQKGRAGPWHAINRYLPYCIFEPSKAAPAERVLPAGELIAVRVWRELRFGASAALQLAAGQSFQPYHVLATVIELQSTGAEANFRLSCAHWGLPQPRSYLTIRDIRGALGAAVTLSLSR